jgi:hypothetical protein
MVTCGIAVADPGYCSFILCRLHVTSVQCRVYYMEWARGTGTKMEHSWRGRESAGRELTIFLRVGLGGGLMWVHVLCFLYWMDGKLYLPSMVTKERVKNLGRQVIS